MTKNNNLMVISSEFFLIEKYYGISQANIIREFKLICDNGMNSLVIKNIKQKTKNTYIRLV